MITRSSTSNALAPKPVTPTEVLTLLDGIERHGPDAPAALAFRSALRRKGAEADAAGGLAAVNELLHGSRRGS